MNKKITFSTAISYIIITLVILTVILPFAHELAKSLSYPVKVETGQVAFLPKQFTFGNYHYFFRKHLDPMMRSFINTMFLVFVGGTLSVIVTALFAYPLSRPRSEFRLGTFFIYTLVVFIILQRPLIPLRLTMQKLGLLDSLWAIIFNLMIIPFLVIMTITFFRALPDEIIESCRIDGANDIHIFFKIVMPLSKAILVTIFLLQAVGFWNAFLQARLFLMNVDLQPIQIFIHSIMKGGGDSLAGGNMNVVDPFAETESTKSALTILSTIPLCIVYLALQKHFTTGITSGSLKG